MERRFLHSHSHPIELRMDDTGKPRTLTGYAAVFYRDNDPGSEFELYSDRSFSLRERLMPGCFDRCIKEDDVRALFNHDPSQILGRLQARTLRLSTDATGLRYEIEPGDTSVARDVVAWLQRGEVTGSSFSFDDRDVSRREIDGPEGTTLIREVRDVKLYDVGPVTFPAYQSTTAGVRSQSAEDYRKLAEEHLARKRVALRTRIGARITELEM